MLQAEDILQNRYQLKQKLGDNTSRQNWLATELETSNSDKSQIVVKLLAFGGQVQWQNLKLFEREAQVLKQLNHPQIPKYQDYFCIDELLLWFGLVEEYLPGSSFKELLAHEKATPLRVKITLAAHINQFIKYSFGSTLTEAELIWLAHEIRDWLQAQKVEEPRH